MGSRARCGERRGVPAVRSRGADAHAAAVARHVAGRRDAQDRNRRGRADAPVPFRTERRTERRTNGAPNATSPASNAGGRRALLAGILDGRVDAPDRRLQSARCDRRGRRGADGGGRTAEGRAQGRHTQSARGLSAQERHSLQRERAVDGVLLAVLRGRQRLPDGAHGRARPHVSSRRFHHVVAVQTRARRGEVESHALQHGAAARASAAPAGE